MITFIIPAHNEDLLIGRTISALHIAAGAMNEPYEIIVVDDASTDTTTTVAARCGARVLSVHYRQIAAARNAGAAQAQGDLLVFVDADTRVHGKVVSAAVHAMRAGAVGGGARARFDGSVPVYGRILAWLWLWIQRFGHPGHQALRPAAADTNFGSEPEGHGLRPGQGHHLHHQRHPGFAISTG